MRFKRIWKRGEGPYRMRVNRRARRFINNTGGATQTGLVIFILFLFITVAILGAIK